MLFCGEYKRFLGYSKQFIPDFLQFFGFCKHKASCFSKIFEFFRVVSSFIITSGFFYDFLIHFIWNYLLVFFCCDDLPMFRTNRLVVKCLVVVM